MTLVIVLNVLLVTLVLGSIVGLHAWAIVSSRSQEPAVVRGGGRHTVRSQRRRRQTAVRRLGSALALR
jgi:hypothetical protein